MDVLHVCSVDEAEAETPAPDPEYLAHLDELLDLRVSHLPALARRGEWLLRPMEAVAGSLQLEEQAALGYPMPPGLYCGLFRGKPNAETIWMSDIPREIWWMWDAIEALRNPSCRRVLITGLGLGVIVKHALRQPHVERVDVIELSSDVFHLVRWHYRDRRLSVHRGDALTLPLARLGPKRATWDFAYHDFWQATTAANLPDMYRVMERFAPRVGAQLCWRQARCFEQAREEGKRWSLPIKELRHVERQFAAWGGGLVP